MKKKIRIMGFGTFDGIHPGHLSYLKQLREWGDEVYVVVARDQNVQKIKGRPPRLDEKKRTGALKKTKLADRIILGDKKDFYQCIRDHQPNIIGLGYDQKVDMDDLKKTFPSIQVLRLNAFEPDIHKSSLLKKH